MGPLSYDVGHSPEAVAVGDFNGDGTPDLAVANYGGTTVSVLLGNGHGTFQAAHNFAAGFGAVSLAVVDFNGDGSPDLAVAAPLDEVVSVLLGNGEGTFQPARHVATGIVAQSVAVGDFNGDGRPDLAVVSGNFFSGTVSVLLGNGDGSFQPALNFAAGSGPSVSIVFLAQSFDYLQSPGAGAFEGFELLLQLRWPFDWPVDHLDLDGCPLRQSGVHHDDAVFDQARDNEGHDTALASPTRILADANDPVSPASLMRGSRARVWWQSDRPRRSQAYNA
jgi:hypothetical protein